MRVLCHLAYAATKTYVTHSPYHSIYSRYKQYWVRFILFFTYADYIFPCIHGNVLDKQQIMVNIIDEVYVFLVQVVCCSLVMVVCRL